MKLYTGDLSPYSAKVRLQIYAKGIKDIAFVPPPAFMTGGFAQTSPLGRIPALDVNGDVIPESEVIAQYIEELYPQPNLLGTTPRARAQVRTVSRIADIYLLNNTFMALPQARRATRNDAIRDLFVAQIVRGMKALEHYLGDGAFAVGDSISIADCTLVPALFLAQDVVPTFDVPNPILGCPKVERYWNAIQTNEHAARVLGEMTRGLEERRAMMKSG